MTNISDGRFRANKRARICSTTFFRKSCHLWSNVEENQTGQRRQYGACSLRNR